MPSTRTHTLACLADVHGNVVALDAVLASDEFAAADAVAFLGCTTTGPDPLGVLRRCESIDKPTIFLAGNGERALLELASQPRAGADRGDDWPTGPWLVRAHGARGLRTIRAWTPTIAWDVENLGAVRLCHGSPRSDIELWTPRTDATRIAQATADITERVIVHGHTHLQYDRRVAGRRVVGAGSVGLPYTRGPFGAQWSMLGPDVVQLTTPYDIEQARRQIVATGYPSDRFLAMLANPPSPEEIILDAEARRFSE